LTIFNRLILICFRLARDTPGKRSSGYLASLYFFCKNRITLIAAPAREAARKLPHAVKGELH
jgi:hypothetical protein